MVTEAIPYSGDLDAVPFGRERAHAWLAATPTNDACTGATDLPPGVRLSGSTEGASSDNGTSTTACGSSPDVWYQFTLGQRSLVLVHTWGSKYDTCLQIRKSSCAGSASGFSDDSCGSPHSAILAALEAGTYLVVVDGKGNGSKGEFAITLEVGAIGTSGFRGVVPPYQPTPGTYGSAWTSISGNTSNDANATTCTNAFTNGGTYYCSSPGKEEWWGTYACPSTYPGTGQFQATVTATGWSPVVYLRRPGYSGGGQIAFNANNASATSGVASAVSFAGGLVSVFIDGKTSSGAGSYSGTLLHVSSACPISSGGNVPLELCDGLNNDCDSLADEGFGVGSACDGAGDSDVCLDGKVACASYNVSTVCLDASDIPGERCDAADNDCDGLIDEGFDVGMACDGTDADLCLEGVKVCNASGSSTFCNDPNDVDTETCNGGDDDCDGMTDEGKRAWSFGAAEDFGVGGDQWRLNNDAIYRPDSQDVRLTPGENDRRGSVWFGTQLRIGSGSTFDLSFTQLQQAVVEFNEEPGADGLAFVIQRESAQAIGQGGSGLGYVDIFNGLAVELDSFDNWNGQESPDSVALVHTLSDSTIARTKKLEGGIPQLDDGVPRTVRVHYDSGSFNVYLDEAVNPEGALKLTAVLPADFNWSAGEDWWFGFTAATAAGASLHVIDDVALSGEDVACLP